MALVGRIHAFVDEMPGIGKNKADIEFADIIEHHVGSCRFQLGTLPGPVDPDNQPEASGPRGLDTSHRVFNYGHPRRGHTNLTGRLEKKGRIRFPGQVESRCSPPVNDEIKIVQQPGAFQNGSGVPA